MSRSFAVNWRRAAIVVVGVGALTLLAALLAQHLITPEVPAGLEHEHMHGTPGPFFDDLLKIYTPRQVCMFHESGVIWLHFVSDFLIALSYFSIPVALVYFIRRRKDLAFTWIFWMFAAFILLCGTTHVIGIWDLWQPLYKVDGIVKLLTGIVSVATAITLWPLIPKALALPSPAMLEERVRQRTEELASANKEREKALDREQVLRKQAERANQLKDDFLATLSHELRTPLNSIFGWAQVLRRSTTDPKLIEGLQIIERSTRTQVRLIEDLLDTNRIVTGKLRLDVQKVDLSDIIESAVKSIEPAANAKEIRVLKAIDPLAGPVAGDAARLQQIVWNLLNNAVKFTPKGGRVQVLLERVNSHLEITVADTGAGITPDFLPHIFERFSQSDSSTTRRFGGLGLGLAIARHLVELHGGSIKAKSPGKDQGATFVIALPVRIAATPEESAKRAHPATASGKLEPVSISLAGLKILAVDDEPDALMVIKSVLSHAGALVVTASSAQEAFTVLQREKPDVMLCDIGMPDEDGYSLLRRIRTLSRSEGGATPAIAVTAFTRSEDRTMGMLAGFQLHIAKPFEADELLASVASLAQQQIKNS